MVRQEGVNLEHVGLSLSKAEPKPLPNDEEEQPLVSPRTVERQKREGVFLVCKIIFN